MSSTTTVALAGATGNLGAPILKGLLDAGFKVTVLTREGSRSTSDIPEHPNQIIKAVDYTSVSSLTSALEGVKVVVSNLSVPALQNQRTLADAAIAAKVARFIPSEFGCDTSNDIIAKLPAFQGKAAEQKYLKQKAADHPDFSYTFFYNGPFYDWGLQMGFLADPKNHKATLYDGGDRPISVSTLSTVAAGIVAVINNLSLTANQEVFIHDGIITQNGVIEAAKKVDGQEWDVTPKATAELERECQDEMKKGDQADLGKAIVGFILVGIFGEGHPTSWTKEQLWNERLGLKVSSKEELDGVVKQVIQG